MTLPQDTRAPHRQQRWIELENVGSSTIPPFGVVEIVESYRPERTGLVPGDGPTVVKVKRPTIDSLPHFYVNGPTAIPEGKRGKPGTNDFPCLALYNQQFTPVSGEMWGTVKDSFLLGKGRQGAAIVGDADNSLGLVRVNRAERLLRISPGQSSLMPGETEQCNVLAWDGTDWQPTSTFIPVADEFFRTCALPGEELWCEAYGNSFQTVSEFGLRRRGIAETQIQPNSTGLINLMSIQPAGAGVIPSCTGNRLGPVVDACYRVRNGTTINIGDEVFVHYHPEFRRWFVLPLNNATLIRFEMTTPLPLGGQGMAIEIGTGPAYTPIGTPFPIKDYSMNPGKFRYDPGSNTQARGYMGWCIIPENPQMLNGVPIREIVQMELIANCIEFNLANDMQGSQAQAIVTYYHDGKNPADSDLFVSGGWGGVLVWDEQGNYPRALATAKGKARYNNRRHRYEIIECNQMAIMLKATVGELCPGSQSGPVFDYEPMTFPPYGQRPPDVNTATNQWNLSHEGSARDCLVWDESLEEWMILQVLHETQAVMISATLGASNCEIEASYVWKVMSVMSCGELVTDSDSIQLTTKSVVTNVSVSDTTAGSGTGECKLRKTVENICTLQPSGAQATTSDIIEYTPQLVVQYVDFVDGCLVAGTALLFVPCVEEGDVEEITCADPCDSGSGSSSGGQ